MLVNRCGPNVEQSHPFTHSLNICILLVSLKLVVTDLLGKNILAHTPYHGKLQKYFTFR